MLELSRLSQRRRVSISVRPNFGTQTPAHIAPSPTDCRCMSELLESSACVSPSSSRRISRMKLRFLTLVIVCLAIQDVNAAVISPFQQSSAENCLGRGAPGPNFCDISTNVEQASANGGLVSVSGTYGSAAAQATLMASASAQ